MSKKSSVLLTLSSEILKNSWDVDLGPLNSLQCCAKKTDTQMWSLVPDFVNAGLWKACWLGSILGSYGGISNMARF